jgi:hypothetical protein
MPDAPPESWSSWWRGGAPFVGAENDAFDAEERETNERRLRVMLPLMVVATLLGVFTYRVPAAHRAGFDPAMLTWRDGAWGIHVVALVVYLALTVGLFRAGRPAANAVAHATGLAFLLNGAALVGAAQVVGGGEMPFLRNILMVVVLFALPARSMSGLFAVGWVALGAGLLVGGADLDAARGMMVRSGIAAGVAAAFGAFLHGARRRDFRLRLTIEKQSRDLAELNGRLEQRVAEQVAALVARNEEVERLNAQLQEQVKDRSHALSRALRRLAAQSPGQESDLEGTELGGRFRVGSRIAVGGMGAVYEGLDLRNGDAVAIKVIRASATAPLALLERFLREARSAASVAHPGVVRMLHVDIDDDGLLYQVQEYVRGETLRDALERHGWFGPGAAARVTAVLAEALAAAHAGAVVHRDVKPANIMLTAAAPGLRLVDFGISKVGLDEGTEATAVGDEPGAEPTRTGVVLGTPKYMSPEQRLGASSVAAPTDVYAVGVVAHLLFTGVHPGKRGAGELPEACAELIVACLDDDPERRPSATEVAERMAAIAAEHGAGPLEVLVSTDALRDRRPLDDTPTQFPD